VFERSKIRLTKRLAALSWWLAGQEVHSRDDWGRESAPKPWQPVRTVTVNCSR